MAARSRRAIRIMAVLAEVAILLGLPLRGDEPPDLLVERGLELIRAGKYERAENALRSTYHLTLSLVHPPGPKGIEMLAPVIEGLRR